MSTYLIRGGKITVTTLSGDAQTTAYLAGKPGHFSWDGWDMVKTEPLPAGTKLDGTYESTVGSGRSKQVWTYTFSPDGKFTGSGGTSIRTAKRDDHYEGGLIGKDVVATKPPAPGHYTISGTTLTVTNVAGETGRMTIFILPDAKQPPLFIGGLYCPKK